MAVFMSVLLKWVRVGAYPFNMAHGHRFLQHDPVGHNLGYYILNVTKGIGYVSLRFTEQVCLKPGRRPHPHGRHIRQRRLLRLATEKPYGMRYFGGRSGHVKEEIGHR